MDPFSLHRISLDSELEKFKAIRTLAASKLGKLKASSFQNTFFRMERLMQMSIKLKCCSILRQTILYENREFVDSYAHGFSK